MWVQMDNAAIKRLEDLQNSMFKNLLAVPHSVPTPSLLSELGCLAMEERIDNRKLNFLFHLKNHQTSSLANESTVQLPWPSGGVRVRPIWPYRYRYRYRYRYGHTDIQQTDTDTYTPFQNLYQTDTDISFEIHIKPIPLPIIGI